MIYIIVYYRLLRGVCCVAVSFGVISDKDFFAALSGLCRGMAGRVVIECTIRGVIIIK